MQCEVYMSTTTIPELTAGLNVQIPAGPLSLNGRLVMGSEARGLVIVANGDGDHLYDETNAFVARRLIECGFATLTVDLLTPDEVVEDAESSALRFHQGLLASRLVKVTRWARARVAFSGLDIGLFASGLCAGAALAAASVSADIRAVVCRGARVDVVVPQLHNVRGEVLLLVGERDTVHLDASRGAFWLLPESARLEIVPNAGHLLDTPEALALVAREAERWFARTLDLNGEDFLTTEHLAGAGLSATALA
jgi:putative phosphoribosyl transferase